MQTAAQALREPLVAVGSSCLCSAWGSCSGLGWNHQSSEAREAPHPNSAAGRGVNGHMGAFLGFPDCQGTKGEDPQAVKAGVQGWIWFSSAG